MQCKSKEHRWKHQEAENNVNVFCVLQAVYDLNALWKDRHGERLECNVDRIIL